MYHCHMRLYFLGREERLFELFREMPPLTAFTHEFFESQELDPSLAAKADVIWADLRGMEAAEAARVLAAEKRPEAELILLLEKGQSESLTDILSEITDIWTLPMPDSELRFHFLRWQQSCKSRMDYWETSQYLETSINSSPDLVWYKDKNGIHEKVNDSFCAAVNKTKAQVEGRGHAYIWDVEQDDPACIESERIVMETKETLVSEEVIQACGEQRILTTYKSPLYDLDGSVMGTVGIGIDVTKEQAYERELIRKNQTLETIFTSMDCGVMCHTLDGSHIISINRAALEISGYATQADLERDGFNMTAPSVFDEDRIRIKEKIASLTKPGDNASIEYRVQHKDGKILHVMGNIKLIEKNGQRFYQRYVLDYTTKKLQEEQERQEAEKRQLELISALGVEYSLVCFFDLDTGDGQLLRIGECKNGILKRIFSGPLSLECCIDRYIEAGVYEEDKGILRKAATGEHLKQVLADRLICSVNYRTTCCGELRYFQMKAARVGDWSKSHGIVLGFRSVDEETRSAREKNAILEDALALANQANKAKITFLSNMSHDIRTPMNAIIGFTNLAITHIDQLEQATEYLEKIRISSNHLLNLINDILDMSNIESGKIHLTEEPCNLSDILHEIRNSIQEDVQAKQLELHMNAADIRHEEICCDRVRLNQVLLNLLGNAIKYTPVGGMVSLRIIEKEDAPAGFANYEFRIKDTGIGMSEEFVSHIFEPFERERNSTISGIKGSGLGMSITKNIVDMMKGTITVVSRQGAGTECTVSLSLRLHDGEPVLDNADEQEVLRIGHILLVEDNELNQEIATVILEEAGFTVEVAGNGQAAVDTLKASGPGHFQAILMDIQMPVMDGYEATRQIRKLENRALASIPILAMTANAFEEDKEEALRSGMDGHIAKPVDVDILMRTLDKVLGRSE